jgi:RNA recognition motif-containing protein
VSLPERHGRRQGYAFVTLTTAAEVDKAVNDVNGKELLGREMRVQKATSSGPYVSENGDHAETSGPESSKRPLRPRGKVSNLCCVLFVRKDPS